jgi:hypothetical protein
VTARRRHSDGPEITPKFAKPAKRTFVVQHRTSKRYLACSPSLGAELVPYVEALTLADAASWSTRAKAEWEREALGEFKNSWETVEVET